MAASSTLSQQIVSRKSQVGKTGVLTLSGFGIKVRMQRGHLDIEDGVGMERRTIRLPRVGHGLKRLIVIGSDGFVSLSALEWLSAQDASFVMLERDGKISCVTGPVRPSEAKLRRAQALAAGNGQGLKIARTLIDAKLKGQEQVLRERLSCQGAADVVSGFRNKLVSADTFDAIRIVEANAAACYFREWRDIPVNWPKADLPKIPDHWRFAGSRQSPLTSGPRLAVTPVHAILNYCFALLEAETRLAVSVLGLDAGLGVGLHTDTANRGSLALDVLEPVRPQIEAWLLNWIASEPFRRSDFFETGTGNCRLMSTLCTKLGGTTSVWGKLVAPWAEYVARALSAGTKSVRGYNSVAPTRLTQRHRKEAKGKVWEPRVKFPRSDHLCRGCGNQILEGSNHCSQCGVISATERFIDVARVGRHTANSPEAQLKRANTQRRNALAQHAWKPSDQPDWLTEKSYSEKIQPRLPSLSASVIARHLSVSRWYAGRLREGYRPHPRHWQALAELVGYPRSDTPKDQDKEAKQ
ncbi:MAG TPA: CRISPR-associated endonuclease Cas1 [Candidatus Sulfotelmatobacter sp.]|nr:CRISPR-associated endonuclease Cas1 [Candidatus Sulfotelmatobacter sp.]